MRFVDLSAPITANATANPAFLRTEIVFSDHQEGSGHIQALFRVPSALLRNQEGWAIETFTNFGTHNSTHVDAPWHYNSQIQGERAATIDELPLEWFFSDGVVLDMTAKADGDGVTVNDIERELARIGYQLKPLDIVMVRTGCDRFYQDANYLFRGPGVTADATRWLYAQGIRVMGIDAWGWDVPLDRQAQETLAKQQPGIFWAAHQVDLAYSQIERLMNLDQLPPYGFKVSCFPLKIVGGSAGPARVVAMV